MRYAFGLDGLSMPLVLLTTFLTTVAVLISWRIDLRPRAYFAWLLLLETSVLGVFTALDLLVFFLFWELELIPMFLLISIWGHGDRRKLLRAQVRPLHRLRLRLHAGRLPGAWRRGRLL